MPVSSRKYASLSASGGSGVVSRGSLLVSVGYPQPYEQFSVPQGFGMSVSDGKTPGPQRIVQ